MRIVSTIATVFVFGPVLLMLVSAAGLLGRGDAEESEEPRPAIERRVLPNAASAPTPMPVLAARPTVAPAKPGYSPEEQAYITYVGDWFGALQTATTDMFDLNDQIGESPALLGDRGWRTRMAASLALVKASGEKLQEYDPVPARFQKADDLIVGVGRDFVAVADNYAAGIDAADAARVRAAASRLEAANVKMGDVARELAAIKPQ